MSQMGISADGGFANEAARQKFASRGDQQPSASEQTVAGADDDEVPGRLTTSCSNGCPMIVGVVLDLVENFDDVSNSK